MCVYITSLTILFVFYLFTFFRLRAYLFSLSHSVLVRLSCVCVSGYYALYCLYLSRFTSPIQSLVVKLRSVVEWRNCFYSIHVFCWSSCISFSTMALFLVLALWHILCDPHAVNEVCMCHIWVTYFSSCLSSPLLEYLNNILRNSYMFVGHGFVIVGVKDMNFIIPSFQQKVGSSTWY